MNFFRRLTTDSTGTSSVELGLILALIVIAMFTAISALGNAVTNSFSSTAAQVDAATNAPSS
ncbi:MAG: Flp family type IVb pilin [Brevundimonas sp.]|jgi:Flp pilus assembly pilin Flp|nr:Flp family type IVb pilin [Brevundimonas sp.]MCZ8321863.1 Flp family type IVb pilin [Novosphingobium sp.]